MVINNLKILLEDTPISHYWMGFILADGSISKDKTLKIELAIKDMRHIHRFCRYINVISKSKKARIHTGNVVFMPKIMEKFDVKQNKTIYPPNIRILKNMSNDLFLATIIGFIDGDGHINHPMHHKTCNIRIKLHSTWKLFLEYINIRLQEISKISSKSKVIINNEGYSSLTISHHSIVQFLKKTSDRLELPVLQRKWNLVTKMVTRTEQAIINKNMVIKMLNKNMRKTDIAKKLGLSNSAITMIIKRNNLEGD